MTDQQQEPQPFVPGQQVTPAAYRWWFFPVPTTDDSRIVNLVIQGPGGDSHTLLEASDLVKFGQACIENGRAAENAPSRLIVPDVQVPPDLLHPNGDRP